MAGKRAGVVQATQFQAATKTLERTDETSKSPALPSLLDY
jgi:hypothetical protein